MTRESMSKPGQRLVRWFDWMPLETGNLMVVQVNNIQEISMPGDYINMQSPVIKVLQNAFNC